MINAGIPTIFLNAEDINYTGTELQTDINGDENALKIYTSSSGKEIKAEDIDLNVRALSMGLLHHAMMGTAAVAIGTAATIPGTLVNLAAGGGDRDSGYDDETILLCGIALGYENKDALVNSYPQPAECTPVKGSDLLYILYTSGTTGKPKGVVRENDVFWAASDVGWVVGHSYIIYAPLLHGCTTILYEGKPIMTPDAGAFWRVISEYGVKGLFTAPTAYRAIKKEDPNAELAKQYDLSCLEALYSAGERLDPATFDWLDENFGLPIVDNWWQTETGWAIASNMTGIEKMKVKPGSATVPCTGFNVQILDENGKELGANEQGNIAIKLPMPPSCLTSVWGDLERFKASYLETYPGYYVSGDGGYIDDEGYLFVMGRVDDVINVAGHRLSTGEMEEIIGKHPAVAECAVIGRDDALKGQMPTGFVVLKNGVEMSDEEITKELIGLVRQEIGAVASFKEVHVVPRLPKTRSGKILRKTMRQIFNGEEYIIPSTIDDPDSLSEIQELKG
ncbi:hypothetical protein GQR58_006830 [Nymphon striatum]|nr:hypothetical protein GQR58_006830 [Nymphon striatum]